MKDVALLALSIHLLKEDVVRVRDRVMPSPNDENWPSCVPMGASATSSH
jgi:hypothetical protein